MIDLRVVVFLVFGVHTATNCCRLLSATDGEGKNVVDRLRTGLLRAHACVESLKVLSIQGETASVRLRCVIIVGATGKATLPSLSFFDLGTVVLTLESRQGSRRPCSPLTKLCHATALTRHSTECRGRITVDEIETSLHRLTSETAARDTDAEIKE